VRLVEVMKLYATKSLRHNEYLPVHNKEKSVGAAERNDYLLRE